MKKLFLLALGVMMAFYSQAQTSNAILFTENGERFTAILNGIRQNEKPETNVKITGLNAEFYKLKVIFESTALGEKNFNLALQLGMENTYVIKKNNKGEYVLRFMSAVPLAEAPRTAPTQTEVVYHANPVAQPVPVESSQTVTTTTTSMTTITTLDCMGGHRTTGTTDSSSVQFCIVVRTHYYYYYYCSLDIYILVYITVKSLPVAVVGTFRKSTIYQFNHYV